MNLPKKTILYFGIFDPNFSRNKIYIDGLRQNGIEVIICIDNQKGFRKYWNLWKKHRALKNSYDLMIVGFPGYIVVPFAKLIANKKAIVIWDALCSFYETQIISRDAYKGNPFRVPYVRMIDWFAIKFSDKILLESKQQRDYFIQRLGASEKKCIVTYTGVDETDFHLDPLIKKNRVFTVLFRGRITKEAGAVTVLKAAKLLENDEVNFIVIGFGWGSAKVEFNAALAQLKPKNVRYVSDYLAVDDLRVQMLSCHVSLGQFGDNERLQRTIPHKAFESIAMKLPYITARTPGVAEILTDGKHCLMVNIEDSSDLAAKIMAIKNNPLLAENLAKNSFELYQDQFTARKIVRPIVQLLENKLGL